MKKYVKALVNLLLAVVLLVLILILVPRLVRFFAPFIAGWIIALIASPMVRFLEEKVKLKRKAGSAFIIVTVIVAVVLVLYFVSVQLGRQVMDLIEDLPAIWAGAESDFAQISKNLSNFARFLPKELQKNISGLADQVMLSVGDVLGSVSEPTISMVGNFVSQLPSVIIAVIMALLSSYFFVADNSLIREWFRGHMPQSILDRYRIVRNSLTKAVGGYLKAQLKIEIWMYLLLVIGFLVLHINYAALIAIPVAILDLLPFFGTGTVLIPWAIVKFLSADYKLAIGLLIIWGVGQLARQVIQPKIVGDSVGVSPIPTLFLLYIGYRTAGVFGMILAVPLGLILYTMYEEGAFDTTRDSIRILVTGFNRFRRLEKEDFEEIEEMERENARRAQEIKQESEDSPHRSDRGN